MTNTISKVNINMKNGHKNLYQRSIGIHNPLIYTLVINSGKINL